MCVNENGEIENELQEALDEQKFWSEREKQTQTLLKKSEAELEEAKSRLKQAYDETKPSKSPLPLAIFLLSVLGLVWRSMKLVDRLDCKQPSLMVLWIWERASLE